MVQDYPGFLTESQRDYLRGEKDLDDHSNPSQFRRRVRNRINGMQKDLMLLNWSPHFDEDDLAKTVRDPGSYQQLGRGVEMSDEQIEQSIEIAEAMSKIYGANAVVELSNLLRQMTEGDQKDIEEELDDMDGDDMETAIREMYVREIASQTAEVLRNSGVSNPEDVVIDFFESLWPDRSRAIRIAKSEVSES